MLWCGVRRRTLVRSQRQRRTVPLASSLVQRLPRNHLWCRSKSTVAREESHTTAHAKAQSSTPVRLRDLFVYAKPELPLVGIGMAGLVTSAAITMYTPKAFGQFIDMMGGTDDFEPQKFLMLMTGLFVTGAAATFVRSVSFNLAGHRLVRRLRKKLFEDIIRKDIAFYDKHRTGDLITRLSTDTTIMAESLTGPALSSGLRSMAQTVGGLGFMLSLSPQLTGAVFLVGPVVGTGVLFYGKYIKVMTIAVQEALARATSFAEERFSNIRTVHAFIRESAESQGYAERAEEIYKVAKRTILYQSTFFACATLIGSSSMLGVLYLGGKMVEQGELTAGVLTSFLIYTLYMVMSAINIASFYGSWNKGLGAASRVLSLMEKSRTASREAFVPHSVPIKGDICFQDVSFAYPTRDIQVLTHLNLEVRSGEVLAVVGSSGSGKSTLAALLLGFYAPSGGSILIDGQNIASLDRRILREHIGVVSQEPTLFAVSVRENILYGRPSATMQELERAARLAHAHEFISGFPDGYDTVVGERGLSLSGGQKQRIAVARALLKNPEVLVLDEATSALDAESERLVQQALETLMQGRTVIVIAHRLSTIRSANRIAMLHNGRIECTGTHDELLATSDRYRELMKMQSRAGHVEDIDSLGADNADRDARDTR